MIRVAVLDEHPVVCDAISALLYKADDLEISCCANTVFYTPDQQNVEDMRLLSRRFPKLKILILSLYKNEEFILKLIKAGAKGHLSHDTNRSEILEAIYTLRNGYEFYAKTITNILLSSYLSDKDIDNHEKETRQKALSVREMEVFKLFAEGFSNREIADKLFISVRTVETHKNNIMKKINLKTTVDLVKFAIKNNIIKLD